MDQTGEIRAQETSEIVANTSTTSNEHERLGDMERCERSALGVDDECIPQNESFNQRGNTDGLQPSLSNANIHGEATVNCAPSEKNNVLNTHALQQNDCLLTRKDSSVENNTSSDSVCTEKRNDDNNYDSIPATLEKQDDLKKSSNIDELLENFINDSDIIDDTLLDISLGMLV